MWHRFHQTCTRAIFIVFTPRLRQLKCNCAWEHRRGRELNISQSKKKTYLQRRFKLLHWFALFNNQTQNAANIAKHYDVRLLLVLLPFSVHLNSSFVTRSLNWTRIVKERQKAHVSRNRTWQLRVFIYNNAKAPKWMGVGWRRVTFTHGHFYSTDFITQHSFFFHFAFIFFLQTNGTKSRKKWKQKQYNRNEDETNGRRWTEYKDRGTQNKLPSNEALSLSLFLSHRSNGIVCAHLKRFYSVGVAYMELTLLFNFIKPHLRFFFLKLTKQITEVREMLESLRHESVCSFAARNHMDIHIHNQLELELKVS